MNNKNLLLSLLTTVLVFGLTGGSYGQDVTVSGFADIIYTQFNETVEPENGTPNLSERKFTVTGEVDFEKKVDPVTFRMDLDIPVTGNQAANITAGTSLNIEQAKFIWALPQAKALGLSLTGGAFNAPIGFEAQDAPDMLQTSNGQLFALVPSNLAGVMLSGAVGPVKLDAYYANEWIGNTSEENSVGALITLSPIEKTSLAVGLIHPTKSVGNQDVVDVVLTTEMIPTLLVAVEYLQDRNTDAYGITLNHSHGNHGLTVRYDMVDNDLTGQDPYTLTIAPSLVLSSMLSTVLEWKYTETDAPAGFVPPAGDGDGNLLTLEFVVTF
jgi:hypothetical protein